MQAGVCRTCIKNPRAGTEEQDEERTELWASELLFVQQYLRRQRAGIVFLESNLLRFEAELAVAAHEVVQERHADEELLRVPAKDLTPEQRERRKKLTSRGRLQD